MADKFKIGIWETSEIHSAFPYWNRFSILDDLLKKGKRPIIVEMNWKLDTLLSTFIEPAKPSKVCVDFTTSKQIYFRSDNALDVGLSLYVVGQKDNGDFGKFKITTDASDGTTPVDYGTWKEICGTIPEDVFAGNAIIDDDGIGTNIYYTCALGAISETGFFYIPEGYWGDVFQGFGTLLEDPQVTGHATIVRMGGEWGGGGLMSRDHPVTKKSGLDQGPVPEKIQTLFEAKFVGGVKETFIHVLICLWKKDE